MKKTISLVLMLIIALVPLVSCKLSKNDDAPSSNGGDTSQKDDGGNGEENGRNPGDEKFIFASGTEVVVVSPEGEEALAEYLTPLADALIAATDRLVIKVKDSQETAAHEIVVGDTCRAITAEAKARLEKAISSTEDNGVRLTGYTVYSDGTSVAIVWTDDFLYEDAVNYFLDNFVTASTLKLDAGYSKTISFVYTDYLEEMSLRIQSEGWKSLSEELSSDERGAEIVESMKTLYSLYTSDMLSWLANLYDPVTGGWYHSNSARNTEGFLPDIASTWTALTLMEHTGMVDRWADAVPDDMKESIGNFVLSLQDPDGYFYHSQWGKGISNDKREEHLRGAKAILAAFGLTPKYPYPGTSGRVSSVSLTSRYSGGAAAAVCSVVRLTATLPQYESVSAYRAWLDSWYSDIEAGKTHFYSFGDELQSQVANMRIYSATLGADLLKITTDFLTSHQLDNGLWDEELSYTATNAVHKITNVYNAAECEIPNAEKIIEAGIDMISDTNSISACVDIYNAWSCISYVVENIRSYASGTETERNEKADSIIRAAREIAPEAIIGAFNKIEPFRKLDGSFSYGPTYSSSGGAGMMTALSHTVEGDILGNSICMTSLVGEIYGALDIETFVPIFTSADLLIYLDMLSELGTVVKDPIITESLVIDFEECDGASDIPTELNSSENAGNLSVGEDEGGNKYLEYTAAQGLVSPQNQPSLDINANKLTASPGYAVIEMDIEYIEGHGTVGNQLMLYGSSSIIMQLGISTQSGAVTIKNSADSTKVLATAPVNQSFKLRIEYYWNEGFAAIYLNDDELPSGVTTDLFPDKGVHQTFTYLHFGAARAQAGVTKVDNIKVEVRAAKSADVEIPGIKPKEREVHDFEYSKLGDISVYPLTVNQGSEGTACVAGDDTSKYLELSNVASTDGYNPSVKLYSNDLKENPNMATVQFDLNFLTSNGAIMYIYGTNKFITQLVFTVIESGGERYVTVKNSGDSTELLRIPASDWFTLKIDYYWNEGYFAFYVNGSETPDAYSVTLPDASKGHSKFDYVQLGASKASSGVTLVDNIIAETAYVENIPEKPETSGPVTDNTDPEEPEGGNTGTEGGNTGNESGSAPDSGGLETDSENSDTAPDRSDMLENGFIEK